MTPIAAHTRVEPMRLHCKRCDLTYQFVAFGIHVCDDKRVFLRLLDDDDFRRAVRDRLDRHAPPKRSWITRLFASLFATPSSEPKA